jgi:hypothetical protein
MARRWKQHRLFLSLVLGTALLMASAGGPVAAQGTIGTILGTVTDESRSVVPGVTVTARNVGTGATQSTTSDDQGRYTIPALPVGDYEVQTELQGFQTVIRTGIRLSVGAELVVDFQLPLGQVAETLTVTAAAPLVNTTSASLGTVVDPTQIRELPLNGRNFEELVLLAPGVNVSRGSGSARNAFTGKQEYWTVSGSRPNGQEILMDGTNIQTYQNRGSGTGILGTSLGVDAIGEFQVLTNTYGAQYGGSGSVLNSVTRSGTNNFHGSLYEFTRNSKFDEIQWPATQKQPFWKHQNGGTIGGPIATDRMFFFTNFEYLKQKETQSQIRVVPNALAREGIIPLAAGAAPAPGCVAAAIAGHQNCGIGTANEANFRRVKPYLDLFPLGPSQPGNVPAAKEIAGYESASFGDPIDQGNGTAQILINAESPGTEYYTVGRFDWNVSNDNSLFVRYLLDDAYTTEPFYGNYPAWPELEDSNNQFFTIGEKRLFSGTLINSLQYGYTHTYFNIRSQSVNPTVTPGVLPPGSLNWSGDLFTGAVAGGQYAGLDLPVMDGTLAPGSGISAIGPGQISPILKTQIRHSITEDLFWIAGAHSFRFGGNITKNQTDGVHAFPGGGTWTFANLANFLRAVPTQYSGPCNYANGSPGCVFSDGSPLLFPTQRRIARTWDFAMYAQDDWKVAPSLTLNLGLRYAPTTNPYDATNQTYALLPVPFGPNGDDRQAAPVATPPPSQMTPMRNFFLRNPSLRSFDPRVGFAWDAFGTGRTAIRGGYGIFHSVMQCRDYCYGSWFSQPWTVRTVTDPAALTTFPRPFQVPVATTTSTTWGTNPYQTTPWMQQWNISVQHEVMPNTVVVAAYVGSRGVHLVGQRDVNPPLASGELTPYFNTGAVALNQNQVLLPNFPGYLDRLVFVTGSGVRTPAGLQCLTATCTLATPDGKPIINPETGRMSYAHLVQTGTTFAALGNTRWNPNFANTTSGITDLDSEYHSMQVGINRRMSNNLSAQLSYTYSKCTDISSGNWSQEGGTNILNPYDVTEDRGNCTFELRHNLSTNAVWMLPFTGNWLVEGWQLSGIFYASSGGPFTIGGITALSNNIGATANRANFVPDAPGCNNEPIFDDWKDRSRNGFPVYVNAACFAVPVVGELGNSKRNQFYGPNQWNFNMNLQKNTRISDAVQLQLRLEVFNVFNHRNYGNPGFGWTQGASTSAASLVSGTPNATAGLIDGIVGTMRQLQLGAKLTF